MAQGHVHFGRGKQGRSVRLAEQPHSLNILAQGAQRLAYVDKHLAYHQMAIAHPLLVADTGKVVQVGILRRIQAVQVVIRAKLEQHPAAPYPPVIILETLTVDGRLGTPYQDQRGPDLLAVVLGYGIPVKRTPTDGLDFGTRLGKRVEPADQLKLLVDDVSAQPFQPAYQRIACLGGGRPQRSNGRPGRKRHGKQDRYYYR